MFATITKYFLQQFNHLFRSPEGTPPVKLKSVGMILQFLLAGTLFSFATQIKLPALGGIISPADLLFLISMLGILWHLHQSGERLFYPISGIFLLLFAISVNIISSPGLRGAIELAQLIEIFWGGAILFSFMLPRIPRTCLFTLFLALLANLITAALQSGLYGYGAILPPADVASLSWGFGHAYTGLFRSRMAFSFFLALLLAWFHPQWLGTKPNLDRSLFTLLFIPVTLLFIAHGQMLVILLPILLFSGALLGKRSFMITTLAIFLYGGFIMLPQSNDCRSMISKTLTPLKNAEYPGELKTNHLDFVAALRLASLCPKTGVGAGRYQQYIGRCYRELPNPSYNDIDTDTQAGWGILCATYGFPAAVVFFLLLLAAITAGIRSQSHAKYDRINYNRNLLSLGGAAALLVLLFGLFISDAFTRGLGWFVALAFLSAVLPISNWKQDPRKIFSPGMILLTSILFLFFLVPVVLKPTNSVMLTQQPNVKTTPHRTLKQSTQNKPFAFQNDFFRILNPSEAKESTPPFGKHPDSQAAEKEAFMIPDGKGTPPENQQPDMKYGGIHYSFTLKEPVKIKVWLRVKWDGSCGNTLNIRMDQEQHSVTIGNDSTYHVWHWIDAPKTWDLTKGEHQIYILNREDGIAFDQIFMTSDPNYFPQGIEK